MEDHVLDVKISSCNAAHKLQGVWHSPMTRHIFTPPSSSVSYISLKTRGHPFQKYIIHPIGKTVFFYIPGFSRGV